MKLYKQSLKSLLFEGIRNTNQGAKAIVDELLKDPFMSLNDAAGNVFWNYQDGNPNAARFHQRSIDKVGKEITKRLARTGVDPHVNDAELLDEYGLTDEEQVLMDAYHNLPYKLHGDWSDEIKLADWRKHRK